MDGKITIKYLQAFIKEKQWCPLYCPCSVYVLILTVWFVVFSSIF